MKTAVIKLTCLLLFASVVTAVLVALDPEAFGLTRPTPVPSEAPQSLSDEPIPDTVWEDPVPHKPLASAAPLPPVVADDEDYVEVVTDPTTLAKWDAEDRETVRKVIAEAKASYDARMLPRAPTKKPTPTPPAAQVRPTPPAPVRRSLFNRIFNAN